MLRRVDAAKIIYQPGGLSGKGWMTLLIGRRSATIGTAKVKKAEAIRAHQYQLTYPIYLATMEARNYWKFQNRIYSDNEGLNAEQVYAMLTTRQRREQQKVERAVAMVTRGVAQPASVRGHIPDDVKQYVWQRDGGRCRHCQAVHELQYDHIIPVALGGGSGPENLQILCGPCNRRKGASLTIR